MTGQPSPYAIGDSVLAGDDPEVAPGRAAEPPERRCARCGAVGTHYLTCPALRLPTGYRLFDAPGPETEH